MFEFHTDDVPNCTTVTDFIIKNTDFKKKVSNFNGFNNSQVYTKPITANLDEIWTDTKEAFRNYGWWGFLKGNFFTGEHLRSKKYGGLSITYNPTHWQKLPINAQTLGNMRYNLGDFFKDSVGQRVWDELVFQESQNQSKTNFYECIKKEGIQGGIDYLFQGGFLSKEEFQFRQSKYSSFPIDPRAEHQCGKNTYSDTYGYCYRTPSSKYGALGKFLDSCSRSYVRSRLATIKSPFNLHWHSDESIFFNTRVNVPIHATISSFIHIEKESNFFENIIGQAFCWDTERPHKVSTPDNNEGERTAIVAGFSPWFDFDSQNSVWKTNEFYGVAHPLEMFQQGCFL